MLKFAIILTAICILPVGCNKEYNCSNAVLEVRLIGYTTNDIDTVLFRRFVPGQNFSAALDSFRLEYDSLNQMQYTISGDTIDLPPSFLAPGNDYQIYLPATGKLVQLSEIVSESKTERCNYGILNMDHFECQCTNNILSVKQDSQVLNPSEISTSPNRIVIRP